MDVSIKGGDEFSRLARRLRKAGERDLVKSLQKSIKDEAKTVVQAQRRAVRALPARGRKHTGLRSKTAGAVRVSVKTTGDSAGVHIYLVKSNSLGPLPKYLDMGKWRHPVFGNRKKWVVQLVPPGWFNKPLQIGYPKIRSGVSNALDEVADKIAHGGI